MPAIAWPSNRVAYSAYAATVAAVLVAVNVVVPEPYMDEIFHIHQAQTYTKTWSQYDEKLTTPPGLYIPSALLARYAFKSACSVPALRAVNAIFLLYLPFLISDLLDLIRNTASKESARRRYHLQEALYISSFPVAYFFGFLYYTDVASLALVLLAYRQALRKSYISSALAGLAALTIRQTNILWIAYVAFEALCVEMDPVKDRSGKSFRQQNDLQELSTNSIFQALRRLATAAARRPGRILIITAPYIPVAAAFLAFLVWNGGIVLGDKSMHVAALHIPQMYYFVGFSTTMLLPYICTVRILRKTTSTMLAARRRAAVSMVVSLCIALTVQRFTITHPFLLADNRHYSFYVWRRIINVTDYSRYALSPAYLVGAVALWCLTSESGTWGILPFLAYSAVTCLTLIPSPLLEFRYFMIPYIVLRLHVKPATKARLALECVFYAVINVSTIVLFLCRPFRWPSEQGWQRFMW